MDQATSVSRQPVCFQADSLAYGGEEGETSVPRAERAFLPPLSIQTRHGHPDRGHPHEPGRSVHDAAVRDALRAARSQPDGPCLDAIRLTHGAYCGEALHINPG